MRGKKWIPIKTAPKNGTVVLLCAKGTGLVNTGYYNSAPRIGPDYGPWRWGITIHPTHWMPIPKLP